MRSATSSPMVPPARMLANQDEPVFAEMPTDRDLELADDWRSGGYPYRNLMSRRTHEREKCQLQEAGAAEHPSVRLKARLLFRPDTVVISVPVAIDHSCSVSASVRHGPEARN